MSARHVISAGVAAYVCAGAVLADPPAVASEYVTWAGAEPDKGATAWYIARYVAPVAVLRTVPTGTVDLGLGASFDTAQSKYRRTHNASAMETLLRDYPSNDPIVNQIARLMHDIEINLWRPKVYEQSTIIESQVAAVAERFPDRNVPLPCFVAYFDSVYAWLKTGEKRAQPDVPSACVTRAKP